jgi:uncharacterized damage-inducible protein DinB
MANTLQGFLAEATKKAAADLEAAVLRIPEEKRSWSPQGDARTALDQAAEIAILNGSVTEIIKTRKWASDFDMGEYERMKTELAKDWNAVKALLDVNTPKVIAAIQATSDEELGVEVQMPWGPMTLAQIISYPYWNMSYHEGQINYIASMLGCLP